MQTPEGNIDYIYNPCGSKVESVARGGEQILYGYDGNLLTLETHAGSLNAGIDYTYNPNFDIESATYAGATENYTYDGDGMLVGAGRFTIIRNLENGLPEAVNTGTYTLSRTYNGYGELQSLAASASGQDMYTYDLDLDGTGMIDSKTETVNGTSFTYDYNYNLMGRLLTVHKDGALVEEYRYNENGERIYEMNTERGISGRDLTYSAEDHLLTAGSVSYAWDADGFLTTRTDGADVTTYDYSSRGELLRVDFPDGATVSYTHGPLGRRIAKQVNGTTVEKYLWSGRTRLLAVYDGSDSLKMRFEYADGRMPYAMTMGGATYYLVYNQVGSLRTVADASGNVVKRIDYDAFGNIIADTNPAIEIPFGFAGGLHDRDTGLVRFGYRDYSLETGQISRISWGLRLTGFKEATKLNIVSGMEGGGVLCRRTLRGVSLFSSRSGRARSGTASLSGRVAMTDRRKMETTLGSPVKHRSSRNASNYPVHFNAISVGPKNSGIRPPQRALFFNTSCIYSKKQLELTG